MDRLVAVDEDFVDIFNDEFSVIIDQLIYGIIRLFRFIIEPFVGFFVFNHLEPIHSIVFRWGINSEFRQSSLRVWFESPLSHFVQLYDFLVFVVDSFEIFWMSIESVNVVFVGIHLLGLIFGVGSREYDSSAHFSVGEVIVIENGVIGYLVIVEESVSPWNDRSVGDISHF